MKNKKRVKIFFCVLLGSAIVACMYLIYTNFYRPLVVQGEKVKCNELDQMSKSCYIDDLEYDDYVIYKKEGLDSFVNDNLSDCKEISISLDLKNRSFVKVSGISAELKNAAEFDKILIQDLMIFAEKVEKQSTGEDLYVAKFLMNTKGMSNEEIKDYLEDVEFTIKWSNSFMEDKEFTICLGDYEYSLE